MWGMIRKAKLQLVLKAEIKLHKHLNTCQLCAAMTRQGETTVRTSRMCNTAEKLMVKFIELYAELDEKQADEYDTKNDGPIV